MSAATMVVESSDLGKLLDIVDQVAGAPHSKEVLAAAGEVLQETIRHHFEEIAGDSAHHKSSIALGASRTGFYEEAAGKVQAPVIEDDGVSVAIDHVGLAQRYFGGDISAKSSGFLTIPARAEAYGHRASEFENLQLVLLSNDHGMLIAKPDGSTKGKKRIGSIDKLGSDVFFWLVRQVHQEPDPTVLPDPDEILNPAIEAAGLAVDAILKAA